MAHDTIRYDAPAAEEELAYLKTVKVGDVRKGVLFPAFETEVEWICTAIDSRWEWEGRFLGLPLCKVIITAAEASLQFDVVQETA